MGAIRRLAAQLVVKGSTVDAETALQVVIQGTPGLTIYFIRSGALEVFVRPCGTCGRGGRGRQGCRVAVLGEGDYFGELAALGGGMRTADVVADCKCQFFELSTQVLRAGVAR